MGARCHPSLSVVSMTAGVLLAGGPALGAVAGGNDALAVAGGTCLRGCATFLASAAAAA